MHILLSLGCLGALAWVLVTLSSRPPFSPPYHRRRRRRIREKKIDLRTVRYL